MADLVSQIEALEHQFMRAWSGADMKVLKALTSRKFRLVIGSRPSVLLDAKSFLDAAGTRFRCSGYRFGDVYARDLDGTVVFATQLELKASVEREDWSGDWWMTDVWRKSGISRKWRLADRHLSRVETDLKFPAALKALQLWR